MRIRELKTTALIFVSGKMGIPASVQNFSRDKDAQAQPVAWRSFFQCSTVQLHWNYGATGLLTVAQSNVDKTNQSYCGESKLNYLTIDGSHEGLVPLRWRFKSFQVASMVVLLDQPDAHASVKDLDFSSDGKFVASLGSSGPCRVWDLTPLMVVANLPGENVEVFGFCRFSHNSDDNQTLYLTAMQGQHGIIVSWNTIKDYGQAIGTKASW
ncbi:SEC12-like protein 1 isoform X2 [Magnolia sinica]|nr:SEC12-like protein 1 isoform X2 [Magnolia sinica]XP_058089177.1 SEC12-like protein 1 isoform X2 [Magnolia sinica]